MDTQDKIHFSNILRQELHAIKVQLWAIEVEKIPNDQKLPLEFDQKLETHWDTLFSSLPQIESLFLGPTILDRKVNLIQWINKLSTYFEGEILGKSYHLFLPPTQSSSAMIWGRSNKWYLSEEVREFDGDSYWFAIFRNLDGWRRQSQATLEEIDWEINDQEVELIFKWRGPFKTTEQVEIESPRAKYWDISFTDESIGNSNNAKATTFLLNVQIGIQNGLNSFEPINLSENQLTTSLKIPIAEFGEQKGISTIPSNAYVDLLVDYFVNLARPHYIEASKQLEVELTKDFHRWLQETEEADRDHTIEQYQKGAINKLISIRQAFFGEELG